MSTFEETLKILKEQFPNKVLLSPGDVAPIINRSESVQANMRSKGIFPIPIISDDKTRKIGINIVDLAQYLSTGEVSNKKEKISLPVRKKQGKYAHLSMFKSMIDFMQELYIEMEKDILQSYLEEPIKKGKRIDL